MNGSKHNEQVVTTPPWALDQSQMQVLRVDSLSKIHGKGCNHCLLESNVESNICPRCGSLVAANNISFSLYPGEILGIIGESGSGKSTIVRTLCFDEQPSAGCATFCDNDKQWDLFQLNSAEQRWLRQRRFGMVYQNPHLGLNFDISAGGNIAERLLTSGVLHFRNIRNRAKSLLQRTEVNIERMDESPGKFSGGMQQRVQIAKALAPKPSLLFLDEVTTGLDLSVQAKILDLILEIQHELGTAMIVVTHDLGVIRLLAARTLVMKNGCVVESGLTDQVLEDPQHYYTQRLVASSL